MEPMEDDRPSSRTEIRDFLIFQVKLILDGAKDVLLFNVSAAALVADLLLPDAGRRPFFYAVLELSERFDLWLNLHAPARDVGPANDGLFGASAAGSPTFLGQLEDLVRGGDEPRRRRDDASAAEADGAGREERRSAA